MVKVGDLVHIPVDGTMGRYVPTVGLVIDIEEGYYQYSKVKARALVELYFPHTVLYFPISQLQTVDEKD